MMTNKKKISIAILGAGRVAEHYKKIILSGVVENYKIIGVCDLKLDKAKSFANHFNAKYFKDFKVMLSELVPDLVLILTPSGKHYEHAKACIEYGCHVLVEKPLTMRTIHSIELLNLARDKNRILCVAFQNRLNPSIIKLREAIDTDKFGKIITATVRLRWCRYQDYYNDDWHGRWESDGGVINQQAIHHIDALSWMMGSVESVCATMENRLNHLEAEDTFVSILKFKNGALGTIEATTAARPNDIEASLSIIGEKGAAVIAGIALNKIQDWKFIDSNENENEIIEKFSQEVENGYGLSHGPLLNRLLSNIINKNFESPINLDSVIDTSYLIHSLYSSVEHGGWVKTEEKKQSLRLGIKNEH